MRLTIARPTHNPETSPPTSATKSRTSGYRPTTNRWLHSSNAAYPTPIANNNTHPPTLKPLRPADTSAPDHEPRPAAKANKKPNPKKIAAWINLSLTGNSPPPPPRTGRCVPTNTNGQ